MINILIFKFANCVKDTETTLNNIIKNACHMKTVLKVET